MNADSVRPLVSSLFFSSSSASSSPLLPLSPLFSLSGFDPLTHQHAMATRHTRHGSVRMSKVHVMAFWGDGSVRFIFDKPNGRASARAFSRYTTRHSHRRCARSPHFFVVLRLRLAKALKVACMSRRTGSQLLARQRMGLFSLNCDKFRGHAPWQVAISVAPPAARASHLGSGTVRGSSRPRLRPALHC